LVLTILSGCTYNRKLEWSVQPSAVTTRIPGHVAVVVPDTMRMLVEITRPHGLTGSAHKYRFPVGERLAPAIVEAVKLVYPDVDDLPTMPDTGKYDVVFLFERRSSKLDIALISELFTDSEQASYSIMLDVQALEGAGLQPIQRMTVNGAGASNAQFDLAIREALQQMADNLATLLSVGFGRRQPVASP
jgi:hypothetical protein